MEKSSNFESRRPLNEAQKKSVSSALSADTSYIHGPPATGKTYTACEIIYQFAKSDKRVRVFTPASTSAIHIRNILVKHYPELKVMLFQSKYEDECLWKQEQTRLEEQGSITSKSYTNIYLQHYKAKLSDRQAACNTLFNKRQELKRNNNPHSTESSMKEDRNISSQLTQARKEKRSAEKDYDKAQTLFEEWCNKNVPEFYRPTSQETHDNSSTVKHSLGWWKEFIVSQVVQDTAWNDWSTKTSAYKVRKYHEICKSIRLYETQQVKHKSEEIINENDKAVTRWAIGHVDVLISTIDMADDPIFKCSTEEPEDNEHLKFWAHVIDECGIVDDPMLYLSTYHSKPHQVVMVGDDKHFLPHVILTPVNPPRRSILHRFRDDGCPVHKFHEQRRAYAPICNLWSPLLYDRVVTTGTRDNEHGIKLRATITHQFKKFFNVDFKAKSLVWIDSNRGLKFQQTFEWNPQHDHILRRVIGALTPITSRIFVLTNYNAQITKINHWMKYHYPGVKVSTPEDAQGQEEDIVILDIAHNRSTSFVADETRLKTALSRAREMLIMIGSFDDFAASSHEEDVRGNMLQKIVTRLAYEQEDDCVIISAYDILNAKIPRLVPPQS